jgi:hypothetical protein
MKADLSLSRDGAHVMLVTSDKARHVRVDVQPEAGPSAVLVLTVPEALNLAALLERAIAEAARG